MKTGGVPRSTIGSYSLIMQRRMYRALQALQLAHATFATCGMKSEIRLTDLQRNFVCQCFIRPPDVSKNFELVGTPGMRERFRFIICVDFSGNSSV
jgi:hypothetical protein